MNFKCCQIEHLYIIRKLNIYRVSAWQGKNREVTQDDVRQKEGVEGGSLA